MRQNPKLDALRDGLNEVILRQANELSFSIEGAATVILYGSRAVGCGDSLSDWDVLAVGIARERRRVGRVDLLCITEEDANGEAWLGSELAAHILEYGVVLKGQALWLDRVQLRPEALKAKMERIRATASELARLWCGFGLSSRLYWLTRLVESCSDSTGCLRIRLFRPCSC